MMKRYLTVFFIILSIVVLFFGFRLDVRWNGILSWGLAFICLICAMYFTKYIPNDENKHTKD